MTFRHLLAIVLSGIFLLALGTYIAGEQTEVAVLRTWDAEKGPHDTKMWIVDYEGKPYVRVGRAGRGWGERAHEVPDVELTRGGAAVPVHATFIDDPATLQAVDAAFRAKYGWVDWWFGIVLRKNAETVRLDPRQSSG
jgi:hypothetical protein